MSLLKQTLEDESTPEVHPGAICYLIKAHLTRFGCHGWIEDFDECFDLLREAIAKHGDLAFEVFDLIRKEEYKPVGAVHRASELVDEYRRAIDWAALDELISALPSTNFEERGPNNVPALLSYGSAFVMRYLQQGSPHDLDKAATRFTEARAQCQSKDPYMYIANTFLCYVEWLRITELQGLDRIEAMDRYKLEADEEDKEGLERLIDGVTAMDGVDGVDQAVSLFHASLITRPFAHPRRSATLSQLALALFNQFQQKGNVEDLEASVAFGEETLSLRPKFHPFRYVSLVNLAMALTTRFEHKGNIQDLEKAIALYRESLETRSLADPGRGVMLTNLASALSIRFEHVGSIDDLQESISLNREALESTSQSHPDRSTWLNNLANSLYLSFQHNGNLLHLDECIVFNKEAIAAVPDTNKAAKAICTNNLASALLSRYQKRGRIEDLEESIVQSRKSLALIGSTHPNYPSLLTNLASSLSTYFRCKGDLDDLQESISLNRRCLLLAPQGNPNRSQALQNLSSALYTRYHHKGSPRDLEECISFYREAKEQTSVTSPSRAIILTKLAMALVSRFRRNGDILDLEESISLNRHCLALMSMTDPHRPQSLSDLALSLFALFEHKGDMEALEACIRLNRESIASSVDDHAENRGIWINNLATALLVHFHHKGDLQDLEECISLLRESLRSMSEAHPRRPETLHNLAVALGTRFNHQGDLQDLEGSILRSREALELMDDSHPSRPAALESLATCLSNRFDHKGVLEDLEECISLSRKSLLLRPSPHPSRYLSLNVLATSLTTRFEKKGDFDDLEEGIALHQEAIDSMPESHPRRPVAFSNLSYSLATRFEHKGDRKDVEESISLNRDSLKSIPPHHPSATPLLSNLAYSLWMKHKSYGEGDLASIFALFKSSCELATAPLLERLQVAQRWISCSRGLGDFALEAYGHAMELIPLLASLELPLERRQNVLVHAKELSRDAAQCAIQQGDLEKGVVYLSTSRSVFWSQAHQLRTPLEHLALANPYLADELRTVSRQLEAATQGPIITNSESALRPVSPVVLHSLAQQREKLLVEIRKIDGFHDFLLPPRFDRLMRAASGAGPIVFLNASVFGCDALIMQSEPKNVQHVPLHVKYGDVLTLRAAIKCLSNGRPLPLQRMGIRGLESSLSPSQLRLKAHLGKASSRTMGDDFEAVLTILWDNVVEPVVRALKLEKTDAPGRIWWCPTGAFVFLPIHAAGRYSIGEVDGIFNYAVSSYCSSPQDIIEPPPVPTKEFTMVAVIEPGRPEPGVGSLPQTRVELERIQSRVPDGGNLIAHVGSNEAPTKISRLLQDIQRSSFVHFGCHALQDPTNPLDSYLLLSGGRLTMSKIIRECQTTTASLAYLSACETAMGDEERPDESLTLVATMMFAGFRGVVGTMWPIHDEDAPVVADVFYRHLFRNGSDVPPDASDAAFGLHLAVKELRERKRPFYHWVPFVHFGI
ncbi:hypothetical protein CC1G_02818 [Coprinopsis cinerea okayama7|uniref:CHAT domain-containing protein n=1 Tax=Coprinopsis cinerea (strain Okayama-7 / 130 / ATCC MYA-4618 / FGSC 9003) TaxID=240176 RepID=A8N049_COPC7|nr:hypothetical protein CC1G_02818 [Coprinopsis cinerea okayama7\|eukprot:XP_001828237.2 hypothetical protein CC1G_02818 [Coprinopsis cinerea okayama7\